MLNVIGVGKTSLTTYQESNNWDYVGQFNRSYAEWETAQWSNCYYPQCACSISRMAKAPEVKLNCTPGEYYGATDCSELAGCDPDWAFYNWNIDGASITGMTIGANAITDGSIQSFQWAVNIDGIEDGSRLYLIRGGGLLQQLDLSTPWDLNSTFTDAGTKNMSNRWNFQIIDNGNKILIVHQWSIQVNELTTAGDLLGFTDGAISAYSYNSSDYKVLGAQFNNEGTRLWIFLETDDNAMRIHMFYTSDFKIPDDLAQSNNQRYETGILQNHDGSSLLNAGNSPGLNISPDEETAMIQNRYLNYAYQYDISNISGYDILGVDPVHVFNYSGALSSDIRAFHVPPEGHQIYLIDSGNLIGSSDLGSSESNCDIWNLNLNADHAPLKDNGIDPLFYGWSEAGNATVTFRNPEVMNLCPCASYANQHYGKDCGITINLLTDGATASEEHWGGRASPCFNRGLARVAYETPLTDQYFYTEGDGLPYVSLPAFEVHAQDADGNYYPFHDFAGDGATMPNVWFTRNLRTKHLHDDMVTSILELPVGDSFNYMWSNLAFPAFVEPGYGSDHWQNHDNMMQYGLIYNGLTALLPDVCPIGWHVSTHEDWKRLELEWGGMDPDDLDLFDFPGRGDSEDVDQKMRKEGLRYWDIQEGYAGGFTGDEWNFNIRAAGWRSAAGYLWPLKENSVIWSPKDESVVVEPNNWLAFDGSGDRVTTTCNDTNQVSSWSFWARFTSPDITCIFSHGEEWKGVLLFQWNGNVLFGGSNSLIQFEASNSPSQHDGEWHHYVVTFDHYSINNTRFWMDDVEWDIYSSEGSASFEDYSSGLTIGSAEPSGTHPYDFEGEIKDFAWFDSVISDANVTTIYNGGVPTNLAAWGSDLKGYWRFDGNVENSAANVPPIGPLSFAGFGDRVTFTADDDRQPSTYSFWARSTVDKNMAIFSHGDKDRGFFAFGASPMGNPGAPMLRVKNTSWCTWDIWGGNSKQYDGNWHHYVVTLDDVHIDNSRLWVDSVEATPDMQVGSIHYGFWDDLVIGSAGSPDGQDYGSTGTWNQDFEGDIKEFAWFDTVLTEQDVDTLYNSGTPNDISNWGSDLQGYWKFDGNADDSSGNDFHGTVEGAEFVTYGCDGTVEGAVFPADPPGGIYSRDINYLESLGLGVLLSSHDEHVGGSIRCVLNDNVDLITNSSTGQTQWSRGGHSITPSHINPVGDWAAATVDEYCSAVGCNSVEDVTGDAVVSNAEMKMWQYNGHWELKACTEATGGKCPDLGAITSITCGGCVGMTPSDLAPVNTCSGPPIY